MFLYHIKFWNSEEEFEKIGISKYSPFKRFGIDTYKEYNLKVLDIEELPAGECKQKEKMLHQKYKKYQYFPLNESFSGKTECFDINEVSLR